MPGNLEMRDNRDAMADVDFTAPDGEHRAYLATPAGEPPWPGLVAVHESFGLNRDMRALSDRLAGMGYLTLAGDFFGSGRRLVCLLSAFRQLRAGHGPFLEAMDAAREWLAERDECTGRVGLIGFCLGGGFALLAAPRYEFAAASVNYGELPKDADRVLAGSCPIVASYGGRDRTLRGRPERLERALTANDVEHDVKVYPEAGHSFLSTEPYPPVLRTLDRVVGLFQGGPCPGPAEDAWQRIDAMFSRHLRA